MADIIRFKFKRNVTTDIGDGIMFHIPAVARAVTTAEGHEIVRIEFNMELVHEIRLPAGLTYQEPRKRPGMTDRMYEALVDAAHTRWIKARADSEDLRRRLLWHVAKGNIEIVEDDSAFLAGDFVTPEEASIANVVLAEPASSKRGTK